MKAFPKLLLLAAAAGAGYVVYRQRMASRAEDDLWSEATNAPDLSAAYQPVFDSAAPESEQTAVADIADSVADKAGNAADVVSDKADQVADAVADRAGKAADSVKQAADTAADKVEQAADTAADKADNA